MISVLCALFIVTAAGWVFTGYLVGMATRIVERELENANAVISINLTSELKRIESAAVAVAGSPLTLPLLQANTPENMEKVNNILDRYHKSLEAAACYLIDQNGLTLASSNRNEKDSFVGQNYTFRPYFQQAIKGGIGYLFAYGTVSKRRGFYASAPVRDKEGQIVGVVTIKKEIEDIETKLSQYRWFLVDQSGIIFISSQPEARLKSLWPLSDEQQQKIILSKQYGPGPFEPVLQKPFKEKTEVTFQGGQYLASQNATPYEGVSVVLLWPTGQISMYRSVGIVLTLLALLLTLSFLATVYIFTQSNFRMKTLLKESQSQAAALVDSEQQLRARTDELESQKEALIEQRRELEESKASLAQTEERSRLILGSMSEGIFGIDPEGKVIFVNPAGCAILGYTEEELLGKSLHDLIHYAYPNGSEFPRLQCSMFLTSQDGTARMVDSEVLWRKDGTAVPVEYATTPVWKDGQVGGTVVSFHDIIERKKAEGLKVEKEVAEEAAARAERAQQELGAKILEIERSHRLFLGREEQIIELKRQVNALAAKAGEKPLYREQALAAEPGETSAQTVLSPPEPEQTETEPYNLFEMLSVDQFQHLLVAFCESVGIAAAIIDLKGEVLAAARWQRACTDFHRVNEKTCARCIESDTELAIQMNEGKPFSVYRCRNGLTDAAAPIVIDGRHMANTFVGQFFTSPPDVEFFRRQAEECGLDAEKYLEAIREVPVVAENKLESILEFLAGMAQTVATMSMERYRAKMAENSSTKKAEELRLERSAAMSLAEDADQARTEVEQYRANLELLVQQRTDELRASEERSRQILETAPVSIAFSTKGRIHFANPLFTETFGAKVGDASPQLYVHPEEREALVERMKRDGIARDHEIQMYDRHKQVRDMLVTFLPITVEGEEGILGWLTDITERRQAERVLQERMEELERFSHLTINREEKMIQLKEEINLLLEQTGREKKYKIVEE
ncbi:MAG: PocR ligand-binding domain-containing protein [Deltaproteobacteria bacterium]|nr:PocR ligand-binding domain-containing protein [Deltaproteobacteria bacterium]